MTSRFFSHSARTRAKSCSARSSFLRSTDGNALIESAFVLPIAIYLFVGVVDYGVGLYRAMEVKQAAQIGAQYAVINGFNANAISQAVVNSTPFSSVSASPAPTSYCGCASITGVVQAACGTTCSDGTAAGTYVSVNSAANYSTILRYPSIPNSFAVSGAATVRLK
jgi:Flp pilus assembly protein TadG